MYRRVASDYFATTGKMMHVMESIGAASGADVREMAENVALLHGIAPVVIVDYLQIMAAPEVHMSDKQAADRNVLPCLSKTM